MTRLARGWLLCAIAFALVVVAGVYLLVIVPVSLEHVEVVSTSGITSCGVDRSGEVWCWGAWRSSRGGLSGLRTAERIRGLARARSVVVDGNRACAVVLDGALWCWGSFERAPRMPHGFLAPIDTGARGVSEVALAGGRLCVVRGSTSTVACSALTVWPAVTPAGGIALRLQSVRGAIGLHGLTLGATYSTEQQACALRRNGQSLCWVLRAGVTGADPLPTAPAAEPVAHRAGLRRIAIASNHGCGITDARQVVCWGSGDQGQLGNGRRLRSDRPVDVRGLGPAVSIDVADGTSCTALADGSVWCWGATLNEATSHDTPQRVPHVHGATSVSISTAAACATTESGPVRCWGTTALHALGSSPIWHGRSTPRTATARTVQRDRLFV